MLVNNVQKIIFVEFLARNTTLVFVKKGINNCLIKAQIQRLILIMIKVTKCFIAVSGFADWKY